jgi:hypothetical protein
MVAALLMAATMIAPTHSAAVVRRAGTACANFVKDITVKGEDSLFGGSVTGGCKLAADCTLTCTAKGAASQTVSTSTPGCTPGIGTSLRACKQKINFDGSVELKMDPCTMTFTLGGKISAGVEVELQTPFTRLDKTIGPVAVNAASFSKDDAFFPLVGAPVNPTGPLQIGITVGKDTGFTGPDNKFQFAITLASRFNTDPVDFSGISSIFKQKVIYETDYVVLDAKTALCSGTPPGPPGPPGPNPNPPPPPAVPVKCECNPATKPGVAATQDQCDKFSTACAQVGGTTICNAGDMSSSCSNIKDGCGKDAASCESVCQNTLSYAPVGECAPGGKYYNAPTSASSSTCFPASATLQLNNGATIRMDALKVGHKVQVGAKEHSDIFMFSHQYTDAQATFVELTTATGAIRLTPGHYLYVNGVATQASAVKVGDMLETATGTPSAVTGIAQVRDTGLYNPHTMHGDVVVNGFRTTTYTDAIHPTMAHALLAPLRAMHAMNMTL